MTKVKKSLSIDDLVALRANGKKPSQMEVIMLIEYRIDLADMIGIDFDTEVMEHLREFGGADVLDTRVVDKPKVKR